MRPTIRSHSARTFSILYKAFRRGTRDLREIYRSFGFAHRSPSVLDFELRSWVPHGQQKEKLSKKIASECPALCRRIQGVAESAHHFRPLIDRQNAPRVTPGVSGRTFGADGTHGRRVVTAACCRNARAR